MSLVRDMIRDFVYGPDPAIERSFNPGAVAVDGSVRTFGVDPEQWSPAEYGSYIATSNAVYTVVRRRATYLSSLPLVLARINANGEADPITSGALYELTRKVNPYWTWRRLIASRTRRRPAPRPTGLPSTTMTSSAARNCGRCGSSSSCSSRR